MFQSVPSGDAIFMKVCVLVPLLLHGYMTYRLFFFVI